MVDATERRRVDFRAHVGAATACVCGKESEAVSLSTFGVWTATRLCSGINERQYRWLADTPRSRAYLNIKYVICVPMVCDGAAARKRIRNNNRHVLLAFAAFAEMC